MILLVLTLTALNVFSALQEEADESEDNSGKLVSKLLYENVGIIVRCVSLDIILSRDYRDQASFK